MKRGDWVTSPAALPAPPAGLACTSCTGVRGMPLTRDACEEQANCHLPSKSSLEPILGFKTKPILVQAGLPTVLTVISRIVVSKRQGEAKTLGDMAADTEAPVYPGLMPRTGAGSRGGEVIGIAVIQRRPQQAKAHLEIPGSFLIQGKLYVSARRDRVG